MEPAASRALARSYLFVPADRPDRFDKAWDSPADEVILDLEDAVAPERKAAAREAVAAWLDPRRPVWLRVNALDTPWFEQDLALVAAPGVAGVMLPKAETVPTELDLLCERRGTGLMPLIETAQGLRRAFELARTPGVVRLAFGAIDFQLDLAIEDEGEGLLFFRSQLVWQSRLAGLPPPVDGVSLLLDDAEAMHREAHQSRRLGFGARLCIHPRQVAAVNDAFAPGPQERAWAARVCEAMQGAAGGAVAVDGRMVDRPVWLKAQRILAAPEPGRPARLRTV
ncbi:HpcH/HpaI aldolase/citrate lyase family protein [Ramlibacter rhizophilus]|uniref:CoA ester lyase n=1 Tax=Ramlibacter rhizophilus TaxID=1781167 RepID=A0A4Z0BGY1_9BURK|nr:CoA ester lyase [Ramlibacter rhizophilus]TFY98555.1 CoA ester lyase [Ramlibacter rhizophilus]